MFSSGTDIGLGFRFSVVHTSLISSDSIIIVRSAKTEDLLKQISEDEEEVKPSAPTKSSQGKGG